MNDNGAALTHPGFLSAEAIRRDRRNVVLIVTVGLLNGLGWAACQNWHWAAELWPSFKFNWWRCHYQAVKSRLARAEFDGNTGRHSSEPLASARLESLTSGN